ncbi:MAG: nucleotidyltransferase family protein [Elusimicrobia bacterium]|nr:nucleotidyltransferase family protein [Elusimicrobiota bacterium]
MNKLGLSKIQAILSMYKKELEEKFKVKEMGVFGSFARNDQNKRSDIDLLVEFKGPIDFFEFLELEEYLSRILDAKVDLVMKCTLKPKIGEHILREVVYV